MELAAVLVLNPILKNRYTIENAVVAVANCSTQYD